MYADKHNTPDAYADKYTPKQYTDKNMPYRYAAKLHV